MKSSQIILGWFRHIHIQSEFSGNDQRFTNTTKSRKNAALFERLYWHLSSWLAIVAYKIIVLYDFVLITCSQEYKIVIYVFVVHEKRSVVAGNKTSTFHPLFSTCPAQATVSTTFIGEYCPKHRRSLPGHDHCTLFAVSIQQPCCNPSIYSLPPFSLWSSLTICVQFVACRITILLSFCLNVCI